MIQYADFGHYSTPGWCPNVQLYIKYKTQHPSFGQPSETIPLSNSHNSLVFNTLPQNKKILPPQLKGDASFEACIFCFYPPPLLRATDNPYKKNDPIVRADALDNRIIRLLVHSCHNLSVVTIGSLNTITSTTIPRTYSLLDVVLWVKIALNQKEHLFRFFYTITVS